MSINMSIGHAIWMTESIVDYYLDGKQCGVYVNYGPKMPPCKKPAESVSTDEVTKNPNYTAKNSEAHQFILSIARIDGNNTEISRKELEIAKKKLMELSDIKNELGIKEFSGEEKVLFSFLKLSSGDKPISTREVAYAIFLDQYKRTGKIKIQTEKRLRNDVKQSLGITYKFNGVPEKDVQIYADRMAYVYAQVSQRCPDEYELKGTVTITVDKRGKVTIEDNKTVAGTKYTRQFLDIICASIIDPKGELTPDSLAEINKILNNDKTFAIFGEGKLKDDNILSVKELDRVSDNRNPLWNEWSDISKAMFLASSESIYVYLSEKRFENVNATYLFLSGTMAYNKHGMECLRYLPDDFPLLKKTVDGQDNALVQIKQYLKANPHRSY